MIWHSMSHEFDFMMFFVVALAIKKSNTPNEKTIRVLLFFIASALNEQRNQLKENEMTKQDQTLTHHAKNTEKGISASVFELNDGSWKTTVSYRDLDDDSYHYESREHAIDSWLMNCVNGELTPTKFKFRRMT